MLLHKPKSYTGLLKMLSDLLKKLQDVFRPYTFQDFIQDQNPQTWSELKELERTWYRAKDDFKKMY